MNATECIKTRRSIREFTPEPVSHEVIEDIVSVAAFAPSWKNTQVSRYVVVEGDLKDTISKTCFDIFPNNGLIVSRASALVVVTYVKNRAGYERDGSFSTIKEDRWQNFDTGVATEAFCLAAHERGVGSVILGLFDEKKVAEAISLSDDQEVSVLIAIGNPACDPEAPKRKDVETLLSYLS